MMWPQLQNQNYMSLVTFRKTGVAVPTPVWFAESDGKLYVMTRLDSGKVKRLRHTARVQVAPCTARGRLKGDYQEATARLMTPEEGELADRLLNQKYGWQKRLFELFQRNKEQRAYIEISA